jgi:formate dehydrogenase major subunit
MAASDDRLAHDPPDHRADHRSFRQHRHRPLDRLTEPLVRDGGVLRPASWDEALERAASGFASARDAGTGSIGVFSCSKSTNEMNFLAQKLARVAFGTNNIDSCNRT